MPLEPSPAPRAPDFPPGADWSALMRAGQDGDARAYAQLLKAVSPYLRSLAWRAGFERDEVEDAVQEILLTIHTIRHTYDPKRPFGPWLAAVARHKLVDRGRSRARRRARETALGEEHETFAADGTNLEDTAGEARRLKAALATLPPGQRRAVEMLRLKELSLKEASAQSGQSPTALKVALHRALIRLRALLAGD
jgi:RNA polymerase sigma-70 factor, ECF subfamily